MGNSLRVERLSRLALSPRDVQGEYTPVVDEYSEEDENVRPSSAKGVCARVRAVTELPRFSMIVAGVILLNVFCMALQAEYPVWHFPGCERHCLNVWGVVNTSFLVFYTVELLMRLSVGCSFFYSADWTWNWFDFILVDSCWFVILLRLAGVEVRGGPAITLFRAVRVVRAVHLFQQFPKLRLLARGFIESLNVVLWVLVLLLGLIWVMAIFCTTLIGQSASEWGPDEDEIRMYFGSFTNSSVTLFQYLTLDDWSTISRLVMEQLPWTLVIFLLYVVIAALVIISLLTGIMAEHMNDVREQEEEVDQKRKREQLVGVLMSIRRTIQTSGKAHDHMVTKEEFKALTGNAEVTKALSSVGIDLSDADAESVFDCLDESHQGSITWDDFKTGMEDLREGVTPKQLFKLVATVRRAVQSWKAESLPLQGHPEVVEDQLRTANASLVSVEHRLATFDVDMAAFLREMNSEEADSADR